MSLLRDKYTVSNVDLFDIRNRNEQRVIKHLRKALEGLPEGEITEDMIMNTYAYALNKLSSRYAQIGTIVLRDPVREHDIEKAVQDALKVVSSKPKSVT